MAQLIANVHVPGHGWYGPAHGNTSPPPEAAALIGAHCWEGGEEPSPDGLVDHDLPPVPPLPDTPPGDDALSWLDEPTEGAEPATPAQLLAQVPDDLEALAAFAEAHGLPVDGRLGPAKLRASLEQALAAP